MKTASTEKLEYTTTKLTENPRKLSTQIFDFWNFVTEIFNHKVSFISKYQNSPSKMKSGHFVLQISPWKKYLQNKWSTPWQSRRKIRRNCQLRFLIFETLSQRFSTTKFPLFQSVKLFQKVEKWPFWFANFSIEKVSTEKMKYTMKKLMENPLKLSTQIVYFWNFVTEIFNHKIKKIKLNYPKKWPFYFEIFSIKTAST